MDIDAKALRYLMWLATATLGFFLIGVRLWLQRRRDGKTMADIDRELLARQTEEHERRLKERGRGT